MNHEKKVIILAIVFLVLCAGFGLAAAFRSLEPDRIPVLSAPTEKPLLGGPSFMAPTPPIMEETCTQAGGTWNSCGSACRKTPGEPCITVCVEYCQCQDDAQCPEGFTCGDYVEEIGLCNEAS